MSRRSKPLPDMPLLSWGDQLRAQKAHRRMLRRRAVCVAIGCAFVLGSTLFDPAPRLVWNASASAPIGLYTVSPEALAEPDDMVVARVPVPFRPLAATRHYLPENVPLVKRVVAAAGDEVCALNREIFVNGYWIAERRTVDGAGRSMPLWHGCVRLRGHQLFLLMDAPDSFDGRYFGVTEGDDVVGKARLLWAR